MTREVSEVAFGDVDLHLFAEGSHAHAYDKLGAHLATRAGQPGVHFSVWAPMARAVQVVGDFNGWGEAEPTTMEAGPGGIWSRFVPEVSRGALYKYRVTASHGGVSDRSDPHGFFHQVPPDAASVVWPPAYEWGDASWMAERAKARPAREPMSIYEVHLGSWMRVPEEGGRSLNYREIAPRLSEHVRSHGFTHVELMPVMEHPFYGSWGYQVTGYFAPSARFGSPEDLMFLIDHLHQQGIGVILDWVPAHFPSDAHALAQFDGTHLYEHADPRQGLHPEWGSLIYNYGRGEVSSFLLSSGLFWLERYHADGLRVDGVSSMLYLDYGRRDGEWVANEHGGRENLHAVRFLQRFNDAVHREVPGALTIAEESTAWPQVTGPTHLGGLGFDLKWDMGWMHDTLRYLSREPVHRKFHHGELTFRRMYAYSERFVLSLSHDEVVYGKGSLIRKMPGDDWQRHAGLRLLYAYMMATPGKKLLFMGGELGQYNEWNHDSSLDWHRLEEPSARGISNFVRELHRVYRGNPALFAQDDSERGFQWIDANDSEQSTLSFVREAEEAGPPMLCVFNFTPMPRHNFRVGVPRDGRWEELLNSDASEFGGSGQGNLGGVDSVPIPAHGRSSSVNLTLPPLGALFLRG